MRPGAREGQQHKLLLISEEKTYLKRLADELGDDLILVVTIPEMALDILRTGNYSAVLFDVRAGNHAGGYLIQTIHREVDPYLPVIVLLDKSDVETTVHFMRYGADDCFEHDRNIAIIRKRISDSISRSRSPQANRVHRPNTMVVGGGTMRRIDYEVTRLAQFDFDVLIEGETGVGKDLIAHELHERSRRSDKPFITVPVKSLSETLIEAELFGHEKGAFSGAERTRIGKLEAANGGTLYIPEISSLTDAVQLKLLHFIQYKTITRVGQDAKQPEKNLDVRLIVATNQSLEEQVANGAMRSDFFYRISGLKLRIPPLRERRDEVHLLAKHFLAMHSASAKAGDWLTFSEEVLAALEDHDWPGNVRELENCIKGAIARCEGNELTLSDFPDLSRKKLVHDRFTIQLDQYDTFPKLATAQENFRRTYLREVLKHSNNNITRAAKTAGLTPQGLRKILVQLTIEREHAD